jgi:hypothetical protein
MSDKEMPRDEEAPEQPAAVVEPIGEDMGLLIVPGSVDPDDADDGTSMSDLGPVVPSEVPDADLDEPASDESTAEAEPAAVEPEAEAVDRPQFTLDELVAEMAGVSAVTAAAPASGEAASVAPERIDVLAAAMSDTFAEAPPVEDEMWTRAPFWAIAAAWVLFSGALAYLLWPTAAKGFEALMGASLYSVLVWGGVALVVIGLVIGAVIRSRAQARGSVVDRGLVGRAILLRALGWTAAGVAMWVVAMIVVSFHAVGVIR